VILVGIAILIGAGVLDRKSFRAEPPWDALIFVGCIVSMPTVFPALQIDKWIELMAGGLMGILFAQNIYVFLLLFSIVIYISRFFIVSMTGSLVLFMVLTLPFAKAAGIHPWVIGFTIWSSSYSFIAKYQNLQFLTAWTAAQTTAGEDFVAFRQSIPFLIVKSFTNVLFLWLCVPLWKWMGFLP